MANEVVVALITKERVPVLWLGLAVTAPLPVVSRMAFRSKHALAALLTDSGFVVEAAKVALLNGPPVDVCVVPAPYASDPVGERDTLVFKLLIRAAVQLSDVPIDGKGRSPDAAWNLSAQLNAQLAAREVREEAKQGAENYLHLFDAYIDLVMHYGVPDPGSKLNVLDVVGDQRDRRVLPPTEN